MKLTWGLGFMHFSHFFTELKRRNVFRVATAYAIAGWLIIQISDTVFPRLGLPEWTVTFVISLAAIGFPISLIIAWAFELTPDGLKTTKDVDREKSITHNTGKKINKLIISSLSLLVIFLLTERIFFAEATILEKDRFEVENASIAVLPFVNMSDDEKNEYFSDGLSEELLNGLAKIDGMQVAGRTSSFSFKNKNEDLRDIAEQLGVKHILEGSVRKEANQIRITAQLIQADNGFHLWSETYDRELTANEVFKIQEEITLKVVEELKVRLLPGEESELQDLPTQDIEAYNAYLEGTQLEVDRIAEDIERAITKYGEAIRLDPSFAVAYARLAYAYALLFNYGDLPIEEAKFLVRKNAEQALLLDESQGKAYQALSLYYIDFEKDFDKAEEMAQKSIELLPNDPMSYNTLSLVYTELERDEETQALTKKAYNLDPLNPVIAGNYVLRLSEAGKHEEALALADQILERNPNYTTAVTRKVAILRNAPYGKLDEAFILMYDRYQVNPDDYFTLSFLYSLARELDLYPVMKDFHRELKAKYPNNRSVDWQELDTHLINNEYDSAEAIINQFIVENGEDFRENFIGPLSAIYYVRGEFQKWIDLVNRFQPELMEENPVIDHTFDGRAIQYALFLELNGDIERAEKIRGLAIRSFEKEREKAKEKGLMDEVLTMDRIIASNTKDFDRLKEILETEYFELNNKVSVSLFLARNRYIRDQLGNDPEFIELKRRIKEDIHSMRENVMGYLKAEGEWRSEWDEEL